MNYGLITWLLVSCDTHHPLQNFSKDNMFAIQPRRCDSSDEELRTIGVLASVCHAEPARADMLQLEVLIWETVAIDALALMYKRKYTCTCDLYIHKCVAQQ